MKTLHYYPCAFSNKSTQIIQNMQKELHRRRGRGGDRSSHNVPVPPPINRADRAHEDRMASETEFMVHNLL